MPDQQSTHRCEEGKNKQRCDEEEEPRDINGGKLELSDNDVDLYFIFILCQ